MRIEYPGEHISLPLLSGTSPPGRPGAARFDGRPFMSGEKEKKPDGAPKEKKRDEALVERLMRRVLEGMGSVVDRKLGREADAQSGFTTTKLIERMKHLVDERARTD